MCSSDLLYKTTSTETLNMNDGEDSVNLNDDQPELIFSPDVNGKHEDGTIPPFHNSLSIHDRSRWILMVTHLFHLGPHHCLFQFFSFGTNYYF